MAIATGGVVPDGADSVVPIEDVEERDGARRRAGGGRARARTCASAAATSLPGDIVVAAGVRLGPVHLGALAAAGVTTRALHAACRAWCWR